MSEINELTKLAMDGYKGNVEKYSVKQSQEVIRQAILEANDGKTTIDYRDIRSGRAEKVFRLVEQLLDRVVVQGLSESDFFYSLVEFRNIPEGDQNVFYTEDNTTLFTVAKVAEGSQRVRRQRLFGRTEFTIPTVLRAVRVYEEMSRVMTGRTDFNAMIVKVAESFRQSLLEDIYGLWANATETDFGGNEYCVSGSYDEDTLLKLISHVEATSNGQTAVILGTKMGLRALMPTIKDIGSSDGLNTIHNTGTVGKFYGTDVMTMPQRYKVGTKEFLFPDNVLTVVAGVDRPIKVVYEGNPLIINRDPLENSDMTQEYFYYNRWGTALVMPNGNTGIGRYTVSD